MRLLPIVLIVCCLDAAAAADRPFVARLVGHTVLPAETFTEAPPDAPPGLRRAGRFNGFERTETLGGISNARTGLGRPFEGQPVQGFSAIERLDGERWLLLSDNGFGSRANSADALLMLHVARPDWDTGSVALETTLFLRDPDRLIPFPIQTEHSPGRYLTGADLDPESLRLVGDRYWIGDEFGPYLIAVDRTGKVTDFTGTMVAGSAVRSPDHHALQLPSTPGDPSPAFELRRSRGFEGMALAADGTTLLPLLEGPLHDPTDGSGATVGGRTVLPLLAFDTAAGQWIEPVRYYPLEDPEHAIGEFVMLDERRGLVIERDWNQGDARTGVTEPAAFKRVYLVDIAATDDNGLIEKLGFIDLLAINDPDGVAQAGTIDGVFGFPFVTIEAVIPVDARHILVTNDNNYPGSTGRAADRADANEMILLEVADFLAQR